LRVACSDLGLPMRFMHDNAPCHKAAKVMDFFANNRVGVLQWPPQSPDLNPIENLWNRLKHRRVRKFGISGSKADLIRQVFEIWNSFELELVHTLYDSIKSRLEQCVERNGKWVDY